MTVAEIHKAFRVIMDKNAEAVDSGGCPAFLNEEIDLFLNQAYIQVICNKFTGLNTLSTPFEGSVKRILDLEGLVKTDTAKDLEVETGTNRVKLTDLLNLKGTDKRMFFVSAALTWVDSGDEKKTKRATVTMIDHTIADRFLETHINKPWIPTPVATIEDNTLLIYIDSVAMESKTYQVDITYVKYPVEIDHNDPDKEITEVPDRVLHEVINRAVVIALENVESKRTETKINLNNLQE